jgi:DnaJ-domain-containing protein 1
VRPSYYQDYEKEIKKRARQRQEERDRERDSEFFKKFFGGFFGFNSEEQEPEKVNPDYPYNVFGLKKSASNDDIKKAYRKAVLKAHPDRGGSNEAFRRIREAWDYFKNIISSSASA